MPYKAGWRVGTCHSSWFACSDFLWVPPLCPPHLIQYTGADLIFQALCLEAFMLQPMGFSGRHTKSHGPGKDGVETGLERTKAKLWWGVVGNCRKLA